MRFNKYLIIIVLFLTSCNSEKLKEYENTAREIFGINKKEKTKTSPPPKIVEEPIPEESEVANDYVIINDENLMEIDPISSVDNTIEIFDESSHMHEELPSETIVAENSDAAASYISNIFGKDIEIQKEEGEVFSLNLEKPNFDELKKRATILSYRGGYPLWIDFLQARIEDRTPVLPDFSYAGYHHGEKEIPNVNYKVFDVTDFGAIPDDRISDKKAIQKAIQAAEDNGSGIVFFPRGRFLINENSDDAEEPIIIQSSKVVLRGSGSDRNGTILRMNENMNAEDANKLWSTPYFIQFCGDSDNRFLTTINGASPRESFIIHVNDSSRIRVGEWVLLERNTSDDHAIREAIEPYAPDPTWNLTSSGLIVKEHHLVIGVDGNEITLKESLHSEIQNDGSWSVFTFNPIQEVGFEQIRFEGRWKQKFQHHRSAVDDGGWSAIEMDCVANAFIRNCVIDDVNRAISIKRSSNVTVHSIELSGNGGHNALTFNQTSNGLAAYIDDKAGHWHAIGVAGAGSSNVIWKCESVNTNSFEAHGAQARCTLFDSYEGGFFSGRFGGAPENLPNHMKDLVLWNFKNTGPKLNDWNMMVKINGVQSGLIMPYIVGLHGNIHKIQEDSCSVFKKNKVVASGNLKLDLLWWFEIGFSSTFQI
jgi:hypothetical protein